MLKMFTGLRPDVTPAQAIGLLVSGVPVVANLARAFGVFDVSPAEEDALKQALTWGSVIAGALFVSDAGLRAARNAAAARTETAAAIAATASAVGPAPDGAGVHRFAATAAVEPVLEEAREFTPEELAAIASDDEVEDPEVDAVPAGELPDDDEELRSPPPAS